MARSKLLAYGTMLVGVCLFFAGIPLAFPGGGAWETTYELNHTQTEMPDDDRPYLLYSKLQPKDQKIVDRAIEGETVRKGYFSDFPPEVIHDIPNDTVYIFDSTDPSYTYDSTQGSGAVVMILVGIVLVALALRFDVRR